jgi:hypothetical protein
MDDALGEEIFWLCPRTWRRPLFERYRAMPMVCEGAFKYSANAMYSFVFIGLWGIALLLGSQAALAVVLFQHASIWVHWYCTEQPDEVVLYGQSPDQ